MGHGNRDPKDGKKRDDDRPDSPGDQRQARLAFARYQPLEGLPRWEAIASYVERNAWQVGRIKASLDDAKSGVPGVPNAAVEEWVKSWDTEDELPRPKAKP